MNVHGSSSYVNGNPNWMGRCCFSVRCCDFRKLNFLLRFH